MMAAPTIQVFHVASTWANGKCKNLGASISHKPNTVISKSRNRFMSISPPSVDSQRIDLERQITLPARTSIRLEIACTRFPSLLVHRSICAMVRIVVASHRLSGDTRAGVAGDLIQREL